MLLHWPIPHFFDRRLRTFMRVKVLPAIIFLSLFLSVLMAESASPVSKPQNADLEFVVYLSRHGVRSPTGRPGQYNAYSTAPWPTWSVPPGYLTAHGYRLMQEFGAFDRIQLQSEGLLTAKGCEDTQHVTIYSDSDQRTRETGKALAAGLFPACDVNVQALPEGTEDPLFHPVQAGVGTADPDLASAAIAGRVGTDPANLTNTYSAQLKALDTILATCGKADGSGQSRTSLLDVPSGISRGKNARSADLRGPLNTASTLTENLLLEYAEGMPASDVGWGCVDGNKLRSLLELHTAASDFSQRTTPIARAQASNLLNHILLSMDQAVTGKTTKGALGRPGDRVLFLVGHDTNLSNVAGLLNLTWVADGRRDDTPPGSALVFELWRSRTSKQEFVRLYYTAQTLEQMRFATELTLAIPPNRVPLFIPGCSCKDFSCTWPEFSQMLLRAIDPHAVSEK
jgi:4-phytase / acid phosphatase